MQYVQFQIECTRPFSYLLQEEEGYNKAFEELQLIEHQLELLEVQRFVIY